MAGAGSTEPRVGTASAGPRGQQLLRELSRLEARVYSEEGIPMFLACINLAEGKSRTSKTPPALAANATLATAFRQSVEDLRRVRANVSEEDVAKLVELLADQDLTNGGKLTQP